MTKLGQGVRSQGTLQNLSNQISYKSSKYGQTAVDKEDITHSSKDELGYRVLTSTVCGNTSDILISKSTLHLDLDLIGIK